MKKLFMIMMLSISQMSIAHEGHGLSGVTHEFYHTALWALAVGVVIAGLGWKYLKKNTK